MNKLLSLASFFLLSICVLPAIGQPLVLEWRETAGGQAFDQALDMAIDSQGYTTLVGSYMNKAKFGDIDVRANGGRGLDFFVAQYNRSGKVRWVQSGGSHLSNEVANALAVDSDDAVIVTGQFAGSAKFGEQVLESAGGTDVFIAKYNRQGSLLWVRRDGDAHNLPGIVTTDTGRAVAVDNNNNIIVAGTYHVAIQFDTKKLASVGEADIFVAKYSAAGELIWVKSFGGGGVDSVNDIVVDNEGNIIVAGAFGGVLDIAGSRFQSAGETDLLLLKLTENGDVLWLRNGSVAPSNPAGEDSRAVAQAHGLALDANDNILLTGYFTGRVNFNGADLVSKKNPAGLDRSDMFLAKYSPAGKVIWIHRAGGDDNDFGRRIAVNSDGLIFVTGGFRSTAEFNNHLLTVSDMDLSQQFVAEYSSNGEFIEVNDVANWSNKALIHPTSIAIDSNDDILLSNGTGNIDLAKYGMGLVPPSADSCETGSGNDSQLQPCLLWTWSHRHWQCPEYIRRVEGQRDCPGIFANSSSSLGAEEIWTLDTQDLVLEDENAVDFFRIQLPNPGDPKNGGHADIRPAAPPFRATEPQPLLECTVVQRQSFAEDGSEQPVYLAISARLNLTLIPTVDKRSRRVVSTEDEALRLYPNGQYSPDFGGEHPLSKTIFCPRSHLSGAANSGELVFSFGERGDLRLSETTGGYAIKAEYMVNIDRNIPAWLGRAWQEGSISEVSRLPCLGGLSGSFPFCGEQRQRVKLELAHPLRLSKPACVAGSASCEELFLVHWPVTSVDFDLQLNSTAPLSMKLWDDSRELAGEAVAIQADYSTVALDGGAEGDRGKSHRSRLFIADLAAGIYVLAIDGTPMDYKLTYTVPDVSGIPTVVVKTNSQKNEQASRFPLILLFIAVGAALILILFWWRSRLAKL